MAFDYYNEENGPIGTFSDINPNSANYLPCFDKPQVCQFFPKKDKN